MPISISILSELNLVPILSCCSDCACHSYRLRLYNLVYYTTLTEADHCLGESRTLSPPDIIPRTLPPPDRIPPLTNSIISSNRWQ